MLMIKPSSLPIILNIAASVASRRIVVASLLIVVDLFFLFCAPSCVAIVVALLEHRK